MSMSVLATGQFIDYPVYYVQMNFDGDNSLGFFITNLNFNTWYGSPLADASSPAGAFDGTVGSSAAPSLLSAVTSWASGHTWGTYGTPETVTVTEYDQTTADATPS